MKAAAKRKLAGDLPKTLYTYYIKDFLSVVFQKK